MRRVAILRAATLAVALGMTGLPAQAVTPHTQADVSAAIQKGIQYLDTQPNSDGSFGVVNGETQIAETALAVIAYGVADLGDVNNLPTTPTDEQSIVKKAVAWLLGKQGTDGTWPGLQTYNTGLALSAISFSKNAAPAATLQTATTNGRTGLLGLFQSKLSSGAACSSTPTDSNFGSHCGGWNYDAECCRSDTSNTGFAMTGLKLSGGVPANVATLNAGWQHDVQDIKSNTLNTSPMFDGGGKYQEDYCCQSFTSNANDTGSMLFGFGYDAVPANDPGVVAAVKFAQDVLDTYEKSVATRTMVYHVQCTQGAGCPTPGAEDGSCAAGTNGCDWQYASGEGGYHYSMWSLSKGLAEYISPNLSDTNNWYSKVVDLLLSQQAQGTDGSWPADLRDDASTIAATGFSIFALGLAASPPPPVTAFNTSTFHSNGSCSAAHLSWTNPTSSNYGGLVIRRRTDKFPTNQNDGTSVANVKAPGHTFDDTGLTAGTQYFYGAFPYDVTGQVFGPGATATASTVVCGDVAPATATATPAPAPVSPPNTGAAPPPESGSLGGWVLPLIAGMLLVVAPWVVRPLRRRRRV